jgi:phenylalanyl-tRNA synthetase beta chain
VLVPLSWVRSLLPALPQDPADVAARLVRAGLEVEHVQRTGTGLSGVVAGRVVAVEELTGFRKPVRYCQVEVGGAEPRGIVCGAPNVAAGQSVAVALPGAVLPGDIEIAARETYGRISDGMICSARELQLGTDHAGILTLGAGVAPGTDLVPLFSDAVLDIAVTPDRGYCLSMRGIAREAASALGLEFTDPGIPPAPWDAGEGHPVHLDDPRCSHYQALTVTGIDPAAAPPPEMVIRLLLAGQRQVSLGVDVTNAVMFELGQPLHAFDRDALVGPITVRPARGGERLLTLDGVDRELHPEDLVIADDAGPIGLAGVMGGRRTEVGATTTAVVLEAAHFDPVAVARMARRHRLPSEASRRFERYVDDRLPAAALHRAAALLGSHAGGIPAGLTVVGGPRTPAPVALPAGYVSRVAGRVVDTPAVTRRLIEVGCTVTGTDPLSVDPPSWRPDLAAPADLAEEVLRLEGYDTIPVRVPAAPAGRGLTLAQRRRRAVVRALAGAGYVQVATVPFTTADPLTLPADDARRHAVRLANPLAEDEAWLRTSLLPGLFAAAVRNAGRGFAEVALFETGTVVLADPDIVRTRAPMTSPPVDRRPSEEQIAALDAALPSQPEHLGVILTGRAEPAGWHGHGRAADWADAVAAAHLAAAACSATLVVRPAQRAPWHPGRCAQLLVGGRVVGHAGELHPRTCTQWDLPARSCATELDLGALLGAPALVPQASVVSAFPPADVDVALVVAAAVPAGDVADALRDGAGPLLESLTLFDLYTGPPVPAGQRSLAYTLTFRSSERTLTGEEVNAARDEAIAAAGRRTGAVLRS